MYDFSSDKRFKGQKPQLTHKNGLPYYIFETEEERKYELAIEIMEPEDLIYPHCFEDKLQSLHEAFKEGQEDEDEKPPWLLTLDFICEEQEEEEKQIAEKEEKEYREYFGYKSKKETLELPKELSEKVGFSCQVRITKELDDFLAAQKNSENIYEKILEKIMGIFEKYRTSVLTINFEVEGINAELWVCADLEYKGSLRITFPDDEYYKHLDYQYETIPDYKIMDDCPF